MRKALTVAALLFAIGFLLTYIGLSVHGIVVEAAQAQVQVQPPKLVPPSPPSPPSSFQFGPPPSSPNLFIPDPPPPPWPVVPVKPKKAPKFAPIPPQDNTSCVAESDPCRLRQVNVI